MNRGSAVIVRAVKEAETGVDYSPRHGACCPYCGHRTKVRDTLPWSGNSRIRYHACPNERCLLHQMDRSIKSIESLTSTP